MKNKLKSLSEEQRQRSMLDIMAAYARPYSVDSVSPDSSNFETLIKSINDGKDFEPLSETYIHKYLNDMVLLGLIN